MMKENKNVPEIRFEGFTEEWEETRLGDITDINSGRDYKHLNAGSIPVYGTGGYLLSVNEWLSVQDAIGIGRKGTINKPYILKAPFWTVDTLFYCIPTKMDDLYFLYNVFQLINWGSKDESTGIPSLSKKAIQRIKIHIPSLNEQQAIGLYFEKLDSLIILHQEKHHKLLDLKKAMLYKLFPKEGETVPEIRFKGFTGEWEEVLIEDLFNVTRGQVLSTEQIKKNKTSDFKYPVYSSQTVNKGLLGYYNKYLFENAITWTTDGANAGDTNYRKGKFYCTNVCGVLINNDGYANYCIAAILNSVSRKHVSYVGNPKLMNNVVKKIKLIIPSLKEQQAISQYFSKLDEIIDLNKQKIDKLKHIKTALLDKMFV